MRIPVSHLNLRFLSSILCRFDVTLILELLGSLLALLRLLTLHAVIIERRNWGRMALTLLKAATPVNPVQCLPEIIPALSLRPAGLGRCDST